MSLTESTVLAEVNLLPQSNTINVRWDVVIKRGDEEISRIPHRKAYSENQRSEFVDEVEGADKYLTTMGWE